MSDNLIAGVAHPPFVLEVFEQGKVWFQPGATLGPRSTRGFEFVWVIEGDVEWRYRDMTYPLPPGTISLSQPGHTEFFRWDPVKPTCHAYVHFNLLQWPASLPAPPSWPCVAALGNDNILHPLFRYFLSLLARPEAQTAWLAERAVEQLLLAFVLGPCNLDHEDPMRKLPAALRELFDHARDRWRALKYKALPLAEMAALCHLSRSHFIRLFQQHLGTSPNHFFETLRLRAAAVDLLRSNEPIESIARKYSYENRYHFSRNFKAHLRVSPKRFRAMPPGLGSPPLHESLFRFLTAIQSGPGGK